VHDSLRGEVLHALGDTVSPLEEEARVEAGGAEAAEVVHELTSVTNQKVLKVIFKVAFTPAIFKFIMVSALDKG
jgi:hypothetical protein